MTSGSTPGRMRSARPIRYGRTVNWVERQLDRIRAVNPLIVDWRAGSAVLRLRRGQRVRPGHLRRLGRRAGGPQEPNALIVLTALVVCRPGRRASPVAAGRARRVVARRSSSTSSPTGPRARCRCGAVPHLHRRRVVPACGASVAGLGVRRRDRRHPRSQRRPGLDAVGVVGVIAQFAAVWAIGVACAAAASATEARVREADERAEAERQSAARVLAEERLRIAQELHDVVAHSMSVIAVQAGVGAHVLDDRPEQARAALEAISATVARHADRDAPPARRAARQRRCAVRTRRRPASPTCRSSSTTSRGAGVPVTLHVDGDAATRPRRRRALGLPHRAGGADQRDQARRSADARRRDRRATCRARSRSRSSTTAVGRGPVGNGRRGRRLGHGLIGMRERVERLGRRARRSGPRPAAASASRRSSRTVTPE